MALDIRINMRASNDAADTSGTWDNVDNGIINAPPDTLIADCNDYGTGLATGVSFSFTGGTGGWGGATNGVNSAGSGDASWVDEAIISDEYCFKGGTNATQTFEFDGLDNAKTYTVQAFGSREGTGALRRTTMTIGASSDSYEADGNSSDTAEITGISPSSGAISVDLARTSGSDVGIYFNAIRIFEETGGGGGSTAPQAMHHFTKVLH